MSLALYIVVVMALLAAGYFLYGRFIARTCRLNDAIPTPASIVNDGVDYVPTKPLYLLSQHFSAIAAAGPIAGPIIACSYFGWIPCILWILFGVILIGAVHDFSSLIASVRHGAATIAEIVRVNLGRRSHIAIMIFLYFSLVYVIVAFTDITAGTFLGKDAESGMREGTVATASSLYLGIAVLMGLCQRFLRMPLWLATLIFVPGTLVAVGLGAEYPLMGFSAATWGVLILAYCALASLTPLWMLLQPRGYLGGFVLSMAILTGVVGLLFGGFTIQQEGFKNWSYSPAPGSEIPLFPLLFVTIACGACSGFHGLVCSGTTSRQVARESHTRMIGYGGMILEGFVAAIALATMMIVIPGKEQQKPGVIYGNGIGQFLTVIIGKEHLTFAATFGAMAFSTFVFDTLDVCARLGRYILQELFGWKGPIGMIGATLAMIALPVAIILSVSEGNAWQKFWTLFGASNQLLAGITLLVVTVWLIRDGKRYWYTFVPMLFMFVITIWSLLLIVVAAVEAISAGGMSDTVTVINGLVAAVLLAMTVILVLDALAAIRRPAGKSGKPER